MVKRLQFQAFQRNFHLTLRPGADVLVKNFRARLIHQDGSSTALPLDQSKIFTGHDTYNEQTAVHAHLEEDLWSIQIMEESEIYVVEPAWRILESPKNPHNDTMVTYRMSDMKGFSDGFKFCSVSGKQSGVSQQAPHENKSESQASTFMSDAHTRNKRSIRRNTCQVHLVGDTDFFKKRCRSNHFSCLSLMVQHLQLTHRIYKKSPFEDKNGRVYTGIGVQVAELVLFTNYSTPGILLKRRHFNEKYNGWTSDTKLSSFAEYMALSKKRHCLNHLFTEYPDKEGVLGLAYVNMLCQWRNRELAHNSAISSGTSKVGFLIPSLAISLVVAHGHNFGANHDPDTPECAPDDSRGGKFIMWEVSVNGLSPNNKRFSKCSLRQIGRSIPARCFKVRSSASLFCGNGIIDPGEQCDAGFFGSRGNDHCCSKHCTLRPGAVCSEINHECCVNCQIAPSTTVCQDTEKILSCRKRSYCSGENLNCKDGGFLADGSSCGEMHKCHSGKCLNPCKQENNRLKTVELRTCQCKENASEACMWCCYDATDRRKPGKCKPVSFTLRSNGNRCYRGTCNEGVCLPDIRWRSRTRLTAYIDFVKTSNLDKLFRSNIVLVVIFCTLIFWVPASIWIESLDSEERRQREELLEDFTDNLAWEEAQNDAESYFVNVFDIEDDDEDNFDFDSGTNENETGSVVSFRLEKPHTRHSQASSQLSKDTETSTDRGSSNESSASSKID
ncbi:hypothetical protein RRG08_025683 [Elysia crispata]|uniref:Disintegrin domain-containing protein n=1 Tax=Elysia crispata TaxID=231223 RepID=A0AAE1E6C0_9GAST|nr:hypothetical protein RRG08_025683 [Elysia crispata]